MQSPWTWIRERFAASTITQLINTWQDDDSEPVHAGDTAALGLRAYRTIAIIHACVVQLATSAAEPDYQVWTGSGTGKRQLPETDPLLQLLQQEHHGLSSFELLEMLVTHLYLAGIAYLQKIRAESSNRVVSLRLLRPDRTAIDDTAFKADGSVRYKYTVGGVVREYIPEEDMIVFKLPHPGDDFEGLSPVEVAAKIADLDARGLDFLRAFFINRGIPAGLLKLQSRVDPIERRRIKELWLEEYGGLKGWHRMAVLDGGADYQQLGLGLNELQMEAIFSQTETRVAMVFGVPLILLGSFTGLSRSTFANYQSAMKHMWISTLKPLYTRVADRLTMGLRDEFPGPQRWVMFDLSGIEALQEAAKDLRTFAIQGWTSDLLTRNKALTLAGQGEEPDGDIYLSEWKALIAPPEAPSDEQEPDNDEPEPPLSRTLPARTNGNGHHPQERHAAADDPFYRAVHRIADHLTPRLRNRFLAAIGEMRAAIDPEALTLAVASGSPAAVVQAIPWDVFQRRFGPGSEDILREGVTRAGRASGDELVRQLDISYSFNLNNPSAIKWAESHAAQLITRIDEPTRQAIQELVTQATRGEYTVQILAREVRQMVGLLPRQITAVARFQERLTGQGVSGDVLARRVDRYAAAQLRARAENIARTELMTAANQGQQIAWEDAEIKGWLRADEIFKVVIITDDDRLDDECERMDGEEAPLHDAFSNGFQQPPFHNQ
jgi:HK97 family phage portal protein